MYSSQCCHRCVLWKHTQNSRIKGRTVCGFSGYERQLSHRTPDKDFKKRQKGWSAKGEWYQHFREIHYWLKSYSGTPETPNNYWINSSWSEGEKKISRKPNFEDETEISRVRSLLVSASLEKKTSTYNLKNSEVELYKQWRKLHSSPPASSTPSSV